MITCVQFLEGPAPKIWEGQKNLQILERLLTTFDFDREYLRNVWAGQKSEKYLINYIPSQVGQKKPGELGPHMKKLQRCILTHPSGHFSGHNILAFRGCCAIKFLHALESDQALLAHTPTGDRGPQKL